VRDFPASRFYGSGANLREEGELIDPHEAYVSRLLKLAGRDPQLGALMPRPEVRKAACEPGLTCDRVVAVFLDGYADRPALGERAYEITDCELTGKKIRSYRQAFNTITYEELHERIKALAMAWRSHPQCIVQRDEFVCIMGFASLGFAVIDVACSYAKAVTVPLVSSSAEADLVEIFSNVQPVVLASRIQDLALCVEHAIQQPSIKSIIVFDYDAGVDEEADTVERARARLKDAGADASLLLLDELIEYGRNQPFSFLPAHEGENEKLAMIIHSSGSTGKPKGACISAKALINNWKGHEEGLPTITVIMAPFNHNMGRNEMYNTLNVGGTACFVLKADMSSLFEDIRLVRPTALVFFPRILDLIYQYYHIEVARRLKSCEDGAATVKAAVRADMKSSYLGDRLMFGAVASAPVSPKVKQFITDCFDILLVNGYSTTETASGGLAIDGRVNREIVIDYRLKDVPELGYFTTDKPHPRGEFCVKTRFGIREYYKQPEATAQLFDEDGYNRTGDIVEELGPDRISIIDRRKSILKLSQGEYVALGPLGKKFEGDSALFNQIFVYGTSQRSYLLAVVVPDMDVARTMLNGRVTVKRLRQIIRDELCRVGQKENLKSFEIPRDFIIEKEKFTQANGLLSSLNKYLIPEMKRKYGPALEAIYEEHDNSQGAVIEELKQADSPLSIREKILRLLKINLGIEVSENDEQKTFYELGGDSLAAALFSMQIEEVFEVSIGGDVILSPRSNIRQWVRMIEDAQRLENSAPSFDSVHGKGAKALHGSDLLLERFIDKSILNDAADLPCSVQPPRTVLLTGANGFMGHILCLRWLEELSRAGGRLICIIRARDDVDARKRLDGQFAGVDANLEARYRDLSEKHLEVLAGDIAEPQLGLSADTFRRLADETDKVCHTGALVNHRLGYRHLFGPNVKGTCELIRLAIFRRKKTFDFISTIGVNELLDGRNGKNDISALKSGLRLSGRYASGYIASKWASEHLLNKAHNELGITVNIFRCDMIMPDRRYRGQINISDMLTRLIYSIITTGLAPETFYLPDAGGERAKSHYRGIPVDILTDAIVGSGRHAGDGLSVFNAYNYLHDDISLDTFVDWIEKAGYSIKRISSHREWHEQMKTSLKSLPPEQKQHTIIDILEAFGRPFPAEQAHADSGSFRALVRSLNNDADIPHLSEEYFRDYLRSIDMLFNKQYAAQPS